MPWTSKCDMGSKIKPRRVYKVKINKMGRVLNRSLPYLDGPSSFALQPI